MPALDVPLLTNNQSFQAININGGSLSTGQSLALNLIGTKSTANLIYIFPGGFTIQTGASLTVAANVNVQIGGGQTVADNGTLNFGSGDSVGFPPAQYAYDAARGQRRALNAILHQLLHTAQRLRLARRKS